MRLKKTALPVNCPLCTNTVYGCHVSYGDGSRGSPTKTNCSATVQTATSKTTFSKYYVVPYLLSCSILAFLLLSISSFVVPKLLVVHGARHTTRTSDKVTLAGDILLGGLFPIHQKGKSLDLLVIQELIALVILFILQL